MANFRTFSNTFNYTDALYEIVEYCYWNHLINLNEKDIDILSLIFKEDAPRRYKLIREAAKRWNNRPTKRKVLLLKKYESRLKPVY